MYKLLIAIVIAGFVGCSRPQPKESSHPKPTPDSNVKERGSKAETGQRKDIKLEESDQKQGVIAPMIPAKPKDTKDVTSGHRNDMEGTEDAD